MLAQLTARLRARQAQGGETAGGGGMVLSENGEAIVLDENCRVCVSSILCEWKTNTRAGYVRRQEGIREVEGF